jgi:hypothetical protein
LFTKLRWLSAYRQINYIAIQRAIKKFSKSYFHIEDNILDKKLSAYVDSKAFSSNKNVKIIISEIVEVYAQNFTENDQVKAKEALMKDNVEMRRKDAVLLSFFAGTLLTTLFISIFVIILPPEDPTENVLDWEEIILTLPILRFCFMLVVAMFFIATDVMILRKFKINYIFIFDLDPHYRVTHV